MSIRPIDMQVLIPKTSEVGKLQHAQLQRPGEEQQHFTDQLNKQILQNQQQVMDLNKTEKTLVKEDENKKKNNTQKKKKNSDDIIDEKDNKKDVSSTSIFDIKI